MVSRTENIFEDFFDAKGLHACNLSLLIGKDRFSYSITDRQHRLAALRSYRLDAGADLAVALDEILREEAVLHHDFRTVQVGYLHPHIATIPSELFDEEHLSNYLQLLVEVPEGAALYYDNLPELDLKLAFYMPSDLVAVLNQRFKSWSASHVQGHLWNYSLAQLPEEPPLPLFVNVHERYLSIWNFESAGKLCYANTFPYENSEGFLYYILMVKQHLNLREQALYIAGDLRSDSEIYTLLEQYQAPIRFLSRPKHLELGAEMQALPEHSYWDLLAFSQPD